MVHTCLLLQDSLTIISDALVDRSVKNCKVLEKFQFERLGYFSVDPDTTPEKVSELCASLITVLFAAVAAGFMQIMDSHRLHH